MSKSILFFRATAQDFRKIPGNPIAYWLSEQSFHNFETLGKVEEFITPRVGMITGDNERFLRFWNEVSLCRTGFGIKSISESIQSKKRWFPYQKGGDFRKWYGNIEYVVDWENDGYRMKFDNFSGNRVRSHNYNDDYSFLECLTWTSVSSGIFSCRFAPAGFLFDAAGPICHVENHDDIPSLLGFLCSSVAVYYLSVINPTINFHPGYIMALPFPRNIHSDGRISQLSSHCISLSRSDWDSYETSWDFKENPLVAEARHFGTIMLSDVYDVVRDNWAKATEKMRELEIRNNEIFIRAYGLEGELSPDVPWNEVSLTCNPWYRYGRQPEGGSPSPAATPMPRDTDLEERLRADTAKELVSYAVGCMMGRYSLDRPGLVLADAGGTLEDYHAKLREAGVETPRFEPDEDGILPILDADWFEDDIVSRFHAFLRAAFGEANFHANVAWLEEALGKDLRTYFVKDFYADHVQRYQKRPIYWLFSSKRGSFQALAYLHRYRPDTPGRVLAYLRSHIAKVAARVDALDRTAVDPDASRGAKTAALRERTKLAKAQSELADYERDVLYPLSTERPALDLDDGVKANYPKLGAALRKIF